MSPAAPPAPRNVPTLLVRLQEERFTGAVLVSGTPGGVVHLRRGLVVAVETPGAPSVETVLLKSRRITEEDWSAARAAAGRTDDAPGPAATEATTEAAESAPTEAADLGSALVGHGLIGGVELEVVCTAAVFDGAFAMSLGPVESWQVEPAAAAPELGARPGVEPRQLAEETVRRGTLLARLWGPLGEIAEARPRPAAQVESGQLAPRHRDLLLNANGRRVPRDLAFAVGRGVFPVMLDLARMRERRLLRPEAEQAATVPAVGPRAPVPAQPSAAPDPAAALPRRVPGDRRPGTAPADEAGPHRMEADATADALRRIQQALADSRRAEAARHVDPDAG
ncbi:hypothetical protein AB0K43_26715 [Kitasatospora sp. NPDC049258]|uniref:hypothetical protein n=1 Tax=Kitasatospora sp. NPDC049258 TaxID=3155394 RepID=UPI00342D6649